VANAKVVWGPETGVMVLVTVVASQVGVRLQGQMKLPFLFSPPKGVLKEGAIQRRRPACADFLQ